MYNFAKIAQRRFPNVEVSELLIQTIRTKDFFFFFKSVTSPEFEHMNEFRQQQLSGLKVPTSHPSKFANPFTLYSAVVVDIREIKKAYVLKEPMVEEVQSDL